MLPALPTELLLKIFKGMGYMTLKLSVAPVCRRFQSIVAAESRNPTGPLAGDLFIEPFKDFRIDDSSAFIPHPSLEFLTIRPPPPDKELHLPYYIEDIGYKTGDGGFVSITDAPFANDNVTSPPWHSIEVHFKSAYDVRDADATNDGGTRGVTVIQLLETALEQLQLMYAMRTVRNTKLGKFEGDVDPAVAFLSRRLKFLEGFEVVVDTPAAASRRRKLLEGLEEIERFFLEGLIDTTEATTVEFIFDVGF